jgi:hypothetical protein
MASVIYERNKIALLDMTSLFSQCFVKYCEMCTEIKIFSKLLIPRFQLDRLSCKKKRAIPLQALTGPEGSRRLRLPDFKTFGT